MIFNANIKRGSDGSKHLDIQIHGVIDGGFFDENPVPTAPIVASLQEHADAKTVSCRINSVGGSLFGGMAVKNALQAHPGAVTCMVEGLAASAASLIAMGGKTQMGIGSMMMIHPPAAGVYGDAEALRKGAAMLDKAQQAIVSVYTAKTGKTADEINKLVNAETWLTAEEAVAQKFADEIAPTAQAPAPDAPSDLGDLVIFNRVAFPRAALPKQILALAKPVANQEPIMNREILATKHPELLAALLKEGRDEGYAAGVSAGTTAERARLKGIDDLPALGCLGLVADAKYGDKPRTASELAVEILKAQKGAGAELLAQRREESSQISAVKPTAPEATDAAAKKKQEQEEVDAAAAAIANAGDGRNARRGGSR